MRIPSKREILKAVIALLRKGWARGAWARDKDGKKVSPTSQKAVCWCPEGAMRKVCTDSDGLFHDDVGFDVYKAFHDATGVDRFDSATKWNDKQTSVKPVIAALKKAMSK